MWAERRRAHCTSSAVTLLLQRELGYGPRRPTHALAFDRVGEDRAAHYELEETKCSLPQTVRSTFLMAFSPDCTKVASTHGDHRIHVCEVATGRLAHTLEGHPRTPWCLAFHPTSNHILASGCLAGQVRVWDLRGGSEVWSSREGTVISSLAFHPLEPLLAIATANRVVLWDWRKGHALATCKTSSEREKVRFVQFCAPRGDSLVTGITNVDQACPVTPCVMDPLLGPQLGALRVPAAPVDTGMNQRRSILTRLMSMYQHLDGLEEMVVSTLEPEPEEALQQARSYARDVTNYSTNMQRLNQLYQQQVQHVSGGSQAGAEDGSSAEEEAGLSPGASGSASTAATGPNSRYFWATFYRLRSICSRLERRMQQHQLRSHPPPSFSSSLAPSMVGRRSGRPPRLRSWVPPHLFGRDGRARPVPSRSAMTAGTSGGYHTAAASSYAQSSSSSAGPSSSSAASSSTSWGPPPALGHTDVSVSLVSLLARLQMSLQSLSSAALTTAVAREQIHQVRVRITEILERLSNVSGYRARLTSLREEIFEAAAAAGPWSSRPDSGLSSWESVATEGDQPRTSSSVAAAVEERHPAAASQRGGEQQLEEPGDEATPSQHWDLAYCLWLVEMSLQLTRQMQRILAADYRLTQLHLNATSSTASSATATTTTATTLSSSSPPPLFSPFASQMGHTRYSSPPQTPPHTPAAASTSRSRGPPAILTTPPSARRSMECPRLRRHGLRRRRHYRRHYRFFLSNTPGPAGSSSSSSDSLDSSDEDDQDLRRMRVDLSPDEDYPTSMPGRGLSAVGGVMGRNRFWPASPPPAVLEDPPIPEVHVSPPSSPPPMRPTAPVPPRPRSPPLPVILSVAPASRGGGGVPPASLDSLWTPPAFSTAYFSLLYDGSFRPRLNFYEAGPNLTHRIQCWDMTGTELPDIGDAKACLVAPRCKIHNDASVALGGGLLAALVPCATLGASLCVYSLRPRGTLLHTWSFGANAISVSLSPMARYLVVGFAATRGYFAQEREVVAQIFKLTSPDMDSSPSCGGGQLQQVGNLSQPGGVLGHPPVSLNSVRWLPRPGEGLTYGTNRGSLCICRPLKPISKEDGGGQPSSHSGPTRDATSPFVMLTDQVDRTARNATIQVLSTASQTVLPQTHTTGTQTTLRGSGLFVEQEQSAENNTAAAASAASSPSSEASDGPSAGPSTSGASSSSEASFTSWNNIC